MVLISVNTHNMCFLWDLFIDNIYIVGVCNFANPFILSNSTWEIARKYVDSKSEIVGGIE